MKGENAGAPPCETKKERDNLALEIIAGPCKAKEAFMARGTSVTIGRTKKNTILPIQDISVRQQLSDFLNVGQYFLPSS